MSNVILVGKAKALVDSIEIMIANAKAKGEASVKVPYSYWYDDNYVGELVFEYYNSLRMPMMIYSEYVDGKAVGSYISIIFKLNPELAIK